jgi:hypothetical protein
LGRSFSAIPRVKGSLLRMRAWLARLTNRSSYSHPTPAAGHARAEWVCASVVYMGLSLSPHQQHSVLWCFGADTGVGSNTTFHTSRALAESSSRTCVSCTPLATRPHHAGGLGKRSSHRLSERQRREVGALLLCVTRAHECAPCLSVRVLFVVCLVRQLRRDACRDGLGYRRSNGLSAAVVHLLPCWQRLSPPPSLPAPSVPGEQRWARWRRVVRCGTW